MRRPPGFWLMNLKKILEMVFSKNTYLNLTSLPVFLVDYLGLVNDKYDLKIANCQFTLRGGTIDKWPIQEIVLGDDYNLYKLRKKPLKTIVDLGAHIGVFSVYAGKLFPNAKIYAYEPDSESFKILKNNISKNQLQKRVFPFNAACYSGEAIKGRKPKRWPKWMYTFKNSNSTTLVEIFAQNNISTCDLLKIDVEGAEYDILYSLPDSIFKKISRIHLEHHNIDNNTNLNGESLRNYLTKKNYSVVQKNPMLRKIGLTYATKMN